MLDPFLCLQKKPASISEATRERSDASFPADRSVIASGNAYTGTDISFNHETSDTYPITLTNQDDDSQPGPAGNIICTYP